MRNAIDMVKKELGEDALILSTRRLSRSQNDPYRDDIFQVEAMPPDQTPTEKLFPEPRNEQREPEADETGWGELRKELGSIREMLYSMSCSDSFADLLNTYPGIFSIYAKLLRTGLSENRARMILSKSFDEEGGRWRERSDCTRAVYKTLLGMLETTPPFYDRPGQGTEVVAFVGPTGAGKTTTIAKLAARLHLEKKKKTGLISIDNYRIGAFDQLKTYASIIGIPCIPAFTKEEIMKALKRLSGMDYILVDTAGQSHLDKKRLAELQSLMAVGCNIDSHLVVSAATGRMDMRDVVESFRLLNPVGYIFTKLDETRRRGGIIDQIAEYPMPVTFLTNGQEVPEDIIEGSGKRTLQLIMDPET